jgi:hypothetical protein
MVGLDEADEPERDVEAVVALELLAEVPLPTDMPVTVGLAVEEEFEPDCEPTWTEAPDVLDCAYTREPLHSTSAVAASKMCFMNR